MKKLKQGRKLSRKKDQRKALLKSLARALFVHGKIKTTQAKQKKVLSLLKSVLPGLRKEI